MPDHIVKAYDRELESLGRRIAEMGGLAEKMLSEAMDALADLDVDMARRVVASDPRLDALQREVEESAVLTIARRQPMAIDLRECVAAIRISGDLERVGDLAKNIAKRAGRIAAEARLPRAIVGLKSMHDVAAMQLKPKRVHLVYTNETKEVRRRLGERLAEKGITIVDKADYLLADAANAQAIRRAAGKLPRGAALNYTGGTKTMSIGPSPLT